MNPIDIKLQSIERDQDWADVLEDIGAQTRSFTDIVLDKFITSDIGCLKAKEDIKKLAPTNIPILILGETGTGKELFAKALHGGRKGHFVAVNTSGIPDTLLEAEFFGCKKGAYTGCNEDRQGYLSEAHNGTLFLDEIGDMPLLLQCKLLRVLQENKSRMLGSAKEYDINCRFIAATNKSLEQLKSFNFREDLLYRLAGYIIKIPSLQERVNDIELICKYFQAEDFPDKHRIYKGNVRELISAIQVWKILRN